MSLDRLKQEILSQGERQAKAIIENARSEEAKIMAEAKAKAGEIIAAQEELGRAQAGELELELRASALLQAKRTESDAKEELVQSVLAGVKEELQRISKNQSRYEKVFDSLAKEAIKALGEKDFVLKTNSRDKKLASKYGRVGETIDAIGGVIAAKADGTIQINNTFEALLEENEEKMKQKGFGELFGREDAARKTLSKPSGVFKPVKAVKKAKKKGK